MISFLLAPILLLQAKLAWGEWQAGFPAACPRVPERDTIELKVLPFRKAGHLMKRKRKP
jgi:hypothetical protein